MVGLWNFLKDKADRVTQSNQMLRSGGLQEEAGLEGE